MSRSIITTLLLTAIFHGGARAAERIVVLEDWSNTG